MPIHDQSYRHWHGTLDPNVQRWLVIARAGIRMLWRRWTILLVMVATIPFLVRVVQIYIVTRLGDEPMFADFASQFQIDAGLFWGFLDKQAFFALLVAIFAGAGLISRDNKHKALQIYFSKPLSQLDYLVGKLAIVGFFLGLVTAAPALLLFVVKLVMSENLDFLRQYYWVAFSILGYYVLLVAVLGGLILMLSSLGKGARFAGIGFFAIIGLTEIIRGILSSVRNAGAVSIGANLQQVGTFLFDQSSAFAFSRWLAVIVLAGIVSVCWFVLRSRIRGTEVVT